MAARYLAIIRNSIGNADRLVARVRERTALREVFASDRMVCFVSDDTPVITRAGLGVVAGHLFTRSHHPVPVREMDAATEDAILREGPRHMLSAFWGGYVALIDTPHEGGVSVLRDPSGALPCLYMTHKGVTCVASDIETLIDAGFSAPEPDWGFLPRHLAGSDLRSAATALAGICELLAGFQLCASNGALETRQVWAPWDHVTPDASVSPSDRSDALREIILAAARTWAGSFNHLLIGVSGGLDSSVLAAALAGGPCGVTCYTLATDEAEGDERAYARLLADHLGLPLREAFHDLASVDVTRSASPHLPRPMLYALSQSYRSAQLAIQQDLKVDAIFSGLGGDNVFCYMASATPVLDRLLAKGLGSGTLQTLEDVCRLTGASVWDVVGMMIARIRAGGSAYRWTPDVRFINSKALGYSDGMLLDPWLIAPKGALPGKGVHVALLTRIQAATVGFSRISAPPVVNPLLSQPVVEYCLSIPSWEWCAGGRNRSIVRDAFEGLLPPTLIARRSKGSPRSFAYDIVQTNRQRLLSFLMDGQLAQRGVVDRDAILAALGGEAPVAGTDYLAILRLAETEAWCTYWLGYPRGA